MFKHLFNVIMVKVKVVSDGVRLAPNCNYAVRGSIYTSSMSGPIFTRVEQSDYTSTTYWSQWDLNPHPMLQNKYDANAIYIVTGNVCHNTSPKVLKTRLSFLTRWARQDSLVISTEGKQGALSLQDNGVFVSLHRTVTQGKGQQAKMSCFWRKKKKGTHQQN